MFHYHNLRSSSQLTAQIAVPCYLGVLYGSVMILHFGNLVNKLNVVFFPDYYNNGGTNGGNGSTGSPSGAASASSSPAPGQSSYGSYYSNDSGYNALAANKPQKKKPMPMHKGAKGPFQGANPNTGSSVGYQSNNSSGQGSYNQYGQGYGQPKKNFSQNQGTGGYSYSTAYPSQVTGGAGSSQDYSYEGKTWRQTEKQIKVHIYGSLL